MAQSKKKEKKKEKRNFGFACLTPHPSLAQFIVRQLLIGLEVQVEIGGKTRVGYVHNLDFAKGSDFVFASVSIKDPDDEENDIYLRVSIHTDGSVNIMPNQPEED